MTRRPPPKWVVECFIGAHGLRGHGAATRDLTHAPGRPISLRILDFFGGFVGVLWVETVPLRRVRVRVSGFGEG